MTDPKLLSSKKNAKMTESNKFRICLKNKNLHLQNIEMNTSEPNRKAVLNKNHHIILKSKEDEYFESFDSSFMTCVQKVNEMKTKHSNKNSIFEICEILIENTFNLAVNVRKENFEESLNFTKSYVMQKIKSVSTRRLREKTLKKQERYVASKEYAIGLKWKTQKNQMSDLPNHQLEQNRFQYIHIDKTLESIFKQPEFVKNYVKHNQSHVCVPGVYKYFCCGQTHKLHDIFRDKNVIQLQLGIDDFEVCSPLKSKTGIHKICAVYLQIRNIPPEISSKLNNIPVVAICKTHDLKADSKYFDNISNLIVDDLKKLERDGIEVEGIGVLKAVLTNLCSDNLGKNMVYGLHESFNAEYYCSICEMKKSECQQAVKEFAEKFRSKLSYCNYFLSLNQDESIDESITKGIVRYCPFNDLKNFNIFQNLYVDLMHDVYEGMIQFFLKEFFDYCAKNNVLTKRKMMELIRDFNFSASSRKNVPSIVNFDKINFNQSAAQIGCLMLHLPLIFYRFHNELTHIWPVMESLLQCMQILNSLEIRDIDVNRLGSIIESHLTGMKNCFNITLKPKHHFLTHYPTVIRKQGPVKQFWMMPFESKHKYFTNLAKRTQNFINITKTMADTHQLDYCSKEFVMPEVMPSKLKKQKLRLHSKFNFYESLFCDYFKDEIGSVHNIKFFIYNSVKYSEGFIIVHNESLYEIKLTLQSGQKHYLLCEKYKTLRFSRECNSVVIEKIIPETNIIINFIELKHKYCYDKLILNNEILIIADCLSIYNDF